MSDPIFEHPELILAEEKEFLDISVIIRPKKIEEKEEKALHIYEEIEDIWSGSIFIIIMLWYW